MIADDSLRLLANKYFLKESVTSFRQLQSLSTGVRIQTDRNHSVLASPMQMNSDQLLSRLYMLGGIAAIAGPLCAAAFYPQFPIWLAVLTGAAIGCPLLVIGSRRDPTADLKPSGSGRFWPTSSEAWSMVELLALAAARAAPVIIFLLLLWLVPTGDDWPIVALRIMLLTTAIGVCYWWFEFGKNKRSNLFRGKLSDRTIDELAVAERRKKPDNPKNAAVRNWELLVVAAFAFFVAAWLLNFNNPGPVLDAGPRRLRGVVKILQWCRGNPNTVVSSAVLVGCFTLGLYVYRVARASIDFNSTDGPG
jgi:hypothetical protein